MITRRVVLALAVLLTVWAAVAAPTGTPAAHAGTPAMPAPDPDPFYAAPRDLAAHHNGDVLRTRRVDVTRYGPADGWQILFRSTDASGRPIAAMTTVLVPWLPIPNRPLLSYEELTNALGLRCAPSHEVLDGTLVAAPAIPELLLQGWAVALPDHLGPDSAYGAGRLGGQIVLDGIRAARRAPGLGLGGSPVGLTGYSGGALAGAWAAALAPTYAPELPIVGAALGGIPANLQQIGELGQRPSPLFGLGFAAAIGLEREYPAQMPLSQNLNAHGIALRNRMANMCTQDIISAGSGQSLGAVASHPDAVGSPAALNLLRQNSVQFYPGAPRTPVYVWQGAADVLVQPATVSATVHHWCALGDRVQYSLIPGLDHGPAGVLGLPQAWAYMAGRFAGVPPSSNC